MIYDFSYDFYDSYDLELFINLARQYCSVFCVPREEPPPVPRVQAVHHHRHLQDPGEGTDCFTVLLC